MAQPENSETSRRSQQATLQRFHKAALQRLSQYDDIVAIVRQCAPSASYCINNPDLLLKLDDDIGELLEPIVSDRVSEEAMSTMQSARQAGNLPAVVFATEAATTFHEIELILFLRIAKQWRLALNSTHGGEAWVLRHTCSALLRDLIRRSATETANLRLALFDEFDRAIRFLRSSPSSVEHSDPNSGLPPSQEVAPGGCNRAPGMTIQINVGNPKRTVSNRARGRTPAVRPTATETSDAVQLGSPVAAKIDTPNSDSEPKGSRAYVNTPPANSVKQLNNRWLITYDGKIYPSGKSTGWSYIAQLLRYPKKLFLPDDLSFGAHQARSSNAGVELADRSALAQYRRRLNEVEQEIDEAERNNEIVEKERLIRERHEIEEHLRSICGFNGKARRTGDDAVRLNRRVNKAIQRAIDQVQKEHKPLWGHLSSSIKTGETISYMPEVDISWEF